MSSHIKQIDVEDAYKRISPHIVRTPVKTCDLIDQMTGRKVYFKCENLQKTGSFKLRGALNAVSNEITSCSDKENYNCAHKT